MSRTFEPTADGRDRILSGLHRGEDESCHLMGIINVTPDSFHAQSRQQTVKSAVETGMEMWLQGATWLDIGGESTRPGAAEVPVDEELRRVIPVIQRLRKQNPTGLISIDTRRPEVARASIEAGADLVNDVSGLRDPQMIEVILEKKCGVCIMHMQGEPGTMQHNPHYQDCGKEVSEQLLETARGLIAAGHPPELIAVDPGIGFGKSFDHNLELLQRHELFRGLEGFALLWGVSRKSMIGSITGKKLPEQRLSGTLGVAAFAHFEGVDILRVHDIDEHSDLLKTLQTLD